MATSTDGQEGDDQAEYEEDSAIESGIVAASENTEVAFSIVSQHHGEETLRKQCRSSLWGWCWFTGACRGEDGPLRSLAPGPGNEGHWRDGELRADRAPGQLEIPEQTSPKARSNPAERTGGLLLPRQCRRLILDQSRIPFTSDFLILPMLSDNIMIQWHLEFHESDRVEASCLILGPLWKRKAM
ncbi:hypothetical protein AAFF_G00154450 [Aldrovandia affinis]|uniref:Uncharacterized protein n=1 Tax=Aldrovandia affinis TaxID=143900 RepID=A0AAD7WWH4_9TELE|nr:hypothetical protein AAFF_G00154450 [Aldrovandia affinis]